MDLTTVNVNVFFFRSNNVLRSPGTSSRHCQSGGIRAHWNWALPSNSIFFFFAFLGVEIEMGHSFDIFLSWHFPYEYSEIFSTNFYYALSVFLEQWMHKKKTRNSRGKIRAMETHFYTMFFFTSFTRIFLWTLRTIPYNFFLCRVSISRLMNAKEKKTPRNSSGKTRAMESHFYTMDFFFPFTRIFLWTFRMIPYIFFLCRVLIWRVSNAKKISKLGGNDRNTIIIGKLH